MKRNLLALFAVVAAIAFSAFTVSKSPVVKFTTKYAVYSPSPSGTNPEKNPANYPTITSNVQSVCQDASTLCWITFDDANNNGLLEQSELDAVFASRDTNHDNMISDFGEVSTFPAIELKP